MSPLVLSPNHKLRYKLQLVIMCPSGKCKQAFKQANLPPLAWLLLATLVSPGLVERQDTQPFPPGPAQFLRVNGKMLYSCLPALFAARVNQVTQILASET